MRMVFRGVAVCLLTGCVLLLGEARAERASCEELLSARASGRSDSEIQAEYQTTRARLSACERIAEHRQRLQDQREALAAERADRAAAH